MRTLAIITLLLVPAASTAQAPKPPAAPTDTLRAAAAQTLAGVAHNDKVTVAELRTLANAYDIVKKRIQSKAALTSLVEADVFFQRALSLNDTVIVTSGRGSLGGGIGSPVPQPGQPQPPFVNMPGAPAGIQKIEPNQGRGSIGKD